MYNLRYHIASLVAVFLSLAIGLLLGTIVVERGTLDRQREAVVEALQDEFRTLGEENDTLSAENEAREDYVSDTLGQLVSGRLAGRTIVVLTNSGRTDGLGPITDAIRMAGGEPVTVTFNEPLLGLEDEKISSVTTMVIGPRLADDLQDSVVASLTSEWTTSATERPLTSALVMSGAMAMGEFPLEAAADAIVVMAAWEDGPDQLALALAEAFREIDADVSGAEATTQHTSIAVATVERGLSAVDHVDMAEGQFSLVYVLGGEAEGYFGVGAGAQARYPLVVMLEPEE